LNRYIKGESYGKIANKLGAPVKSIDNAIQRIRKKAIKNLYDYMN
jgi:DNA-directed RNA polymerase specialized sigma24 family protein